jgi:hypothetical protein
MRILFLLLISFSSFLGIAQPRGFIAVNSTHVQTSTADSEISPVTVTFKNDQRSNAAIAVDATTSENITFWKWEVYDSETRQLFDVSFDTDPNFYISTLGFYDLKLTVKNSVDTYTKRWDRAWFINLPKFTEEEADIVISAGTSYYNDFASADNSGLKIFIKAGTWDGYISPNNLQGGAGLENHVRFQVEGDVNLTASGGIAHTWWFYGDCRNIIVDGFKSDGTNGLHLTGLTDGSGQVMIAKNGKFTDLLVMGVDVSHNIGAFAAGIAFIPDIDAGSNSTNWVMENLVVYRCTGTNTGQEFIYMGYNNDAPQSGNAPPKGRNCVIARNSCNNTGRDSYQMGGMVNMRMHDNVGLNWGLDQEKDQENFISCNAGNTGLIYNNIGIGGKMLFNNQSGRTPWDVEDGETSPGEIFIFSNYFDVDTYAPGGYAETHAMYGQTYNGSGAGSFKMHFVHNTIITDKKVYEFYCQPSGFNISGFTFANNIITRVGASAGDWPEFNIVENGYTLTDISVNNLVRAVGSESDVLFTDLPNNDVTISSFSSTAYGATTDLTTRLSSISEYFNDLSGYPMIAPGEDPTFGAYSGYEKRTLVPPTGDTSPATFSTPVTMTSLNQSGGTLGYEASKDGILYYVVSATDNAPSKAQIIAGLDYVNGEPVIEGELDDVGTVIPSVITGGSEATNYYLFCVFVTLNHIEQSAVTRVAFTTTSDVTAPTLSGFNITDGQRSRVNFNSSEVITGTTFSNFTISGKTISSLTINSGQTTGHYFTVSVAFNASDVPTIAYSGSNNFQDIASPPNVLASFGATAIDNNIVPAVEENWVAGASLVSQSTRPQPQVRVELKQAK